MCLIIKSFIKNDLPAKDLTFNKAKFNVLKAFSANLKLTVADEYHNIKFDKSVELVELTLLPIKTEMESPEEEPASGCWWGLLYEAAGPWPVGERTGILGIVEVG